MKRALSYGCLVVGVLVVVAVIWIGKSAYTTANIMLVEDNITRQGYRVIDAIQAYDKKTGSTPAHLTDLIPDYLDKLPDIENVDRIEYINDQEKGWWTLELYSNAFPLPRVFLYRSDDVLTEEERARRLGNLHGFEILSVEQATGTD